jgi:hypothetical protein
MERIISQGGVARARDCMEQGVVVVVVVVVVVNTFLGRRRVVFGASVIDRLMTRDLDMSWVGS